MSKGIALLHSKRPLTRFRDITDNIRLIFKYTQDADFRTFADNTLVRDAVERCLARISEAAVKIGPLAEQLLPSHDWRGIRNLGNVLRHDYDGVDDRVIWAIISCRLEPLSEDIESFVSQFPEDQEDL